MSLIRMHAYSAAAAKCIPTPISSLAWPDPTLKNREGLGGVGLCETPAGMYTHAQATGENCLLLAIKTSVCENRKAYS